jgi:hypothetical protein
MFIAALPGSTRRGEPIASDADVQRLRALSWKELRALAERHGVRIRGLRTKAQVASALLVSPAADEVLREVEAHMGTPPDAERIGDAMAATRDLIREASNLGASIGGSEDAWKSGNQALEEGDLAQAWNCFERAARLATEARERRIKEIEGGLATVEDHVSAARKIGADVAAAEALWAQAKAAVASREYVPAGELIKQAERRAMEASQRQIQRAVELREGQIARAQAIIAACEPIVQEAESYDLSIADVRTLLRQARDVLAKGDYVTGLTFARNAEEAAYHLSSQLDEERRRRGIARPVLATCAVCGSGYLTFYEDGWGRCSDCGGEFRWRGFLGIRERLRELLGT